MLIHMIMPYPLDKIKNGKIKLADVKNDQTKYKTEFKRNKKRTQKIKKAKKLVIQY